MKRMTAVRLTVLGVLAVLVAATLAVVATQGSRQQPGATGSGGGSSTPAPTSTVTPLRTFTAAQAGTNFLTDYVDPDGRVVRRDQGGDTVSEGQAYAMLVAVGTKDQTTFDAVWSWTKLHLMRPDGTMAWRWQGGQVVDNSSASDADLDAARALVLAGDRFDDPTLTAAGVKLGNAILSTETVNTDLGRILVAGNWARTDPYAYNPSYASPAAFAILSKASGDKRWAELESGSQAATKAVLDNADLPPDWAQVHSDGTVDPMPGAAGRGNDGVRYSYDATRMPLRYAESCDATDVALSARLATALARFSGNPAARDLGGKPLTQDQSPVAAAAQAAVFAAAGDEQQAEAQLVIADHLQQQAPTYYGGAWDALGRLMLEGDSLGGCVRINQ